MGDISGKDLAYRALASVIGGPVDLATMVMRPFGYSIEKPTLGSEWIGQKIEQSGLVSDARDPLKEFVASIMTPSPGGLAAGLGKGAALLPAIAGMAKSGKIGDVFKGFTPVSKSTARNWFDTRIYDDLSKTSTTKDLPPLDAPVLGNVDPYVYHGTNDAKLSEIVHGGLKASKEGYEGSGVYFANDPKRIFKFVDEGANLYRVKKQDLDNTYGIVGPGNKSGRVALGEDVVVEGRDSVVPPGIIEVLTEDGWKSLGLYK